MIRKILFSVCFCLLTVVSIGQKKAEQSILALLNTQTEKWNAGDIRGFMEYYWQSDSLMFIGKNGITYGWNNTLANYKKGYPDTAAMGKLDFTILHLERLSSRHYTVTGKWHLSRKAGDLQGHFTLLLRRGGKKWRIISDHTS